MKEFLKEWGLPIIIAIIAIPTYLYFNSANFAHMVDRSIESPPYLSLKNNSLYIDEFKFSVGMNGENLVSGDFDKLNEKVYKLLKGKYGKCEIYLNVKSKDKYGASTGGYQSFGSLDLQELNKYQSVDYWKQSGGLQPILTGNQVSTDTAEVVEEASSLQKLTTKPVATVNKASAVKLANFHFNGMDYKPWLYYKVEGDKMTELALTDSRITEAIQYWEKFIDDIKDIDAVCRNEFATLTITTPKGKSDFKLKRTYPDTYNIEGNPSIGLEIKSPEECNVFFLSNDLCVSVNNKSLEP